MSESFEKPKNRELELPDPNPKSMFINPTNKYEIQQIIHNRKLKNGGVDKINVRTLKVISPYITDSLAGILNKCVETSTWPDALNAAEIIPVHKSGYKNKMENYRPILLISNIAKIFEKIIYNRIYNWITLNHILSETQYGFIKIEEPKML